MTLGICKAGRPSKAVITTHDPLDPGMQDHLRLQVADALPEGTSLSFATDPARAPGLVLRVGGAQLG